MTFHHKSIKKFGIEGTLYDEAHTDRLKREYLALVILQMKTEGYVVRADIDPDWTMAYINPAKGFKFKLSVYGSYVGKKKAQQVDRLYGYKPQYNPKAQNADTKQKTDTT